MYVKLSIVYLVALGILIPGQLSAGNWRSYLSYYQTIAIAQGNQKIYSANENGLFSYHLTDKSFETFSRVEGLSDTGISAISWSLSKGALIIGYSNGNLDLLSGNTVLNLPDLKLKGSIPVKTIHHILCDGDFAWLSCDFGIVKINLKKWEVAETWMIGPDASAIRVLELAIDGLFFWAATQSGVYRAERNHPNLQDYKNWKRQDQLPNNQFNSIVQFNSRIYTCDNSDKVYAFDGSAWQVVFPAIHGVLKIRSSPSALAMITDKSIEVTGTTTPASIINYGNLLPATSKIVPTDVIIGSSGEYWIGDHIFGLIQKSNPGQYLSFVPTCPANNNSYRLFSRASDLYIASGGDRPESPIVAAELHHLKENNWMSVNAYTDTKLAGLNNITRVLPSPDQPDHYWGTTRADGLLEFDGQKMIHHYTPANSVLEGNSTTCQTGGIAYDESGNLWVTNPKGRNQLHVIKPDGSWKSMSYPGIDNQFSSAGELLISKTGTKWIIVSNSDLFALRTGNTLENTVDDTYRKTSVRSRFTNSETTVIRGYNQLNALAEDLDGLLWVGTENGVVLYTNPEGLFGNNEFYGVQPSVDLGDGLFHPLLENEKVNAIAVDGGNRKWFATANSGVFLFTADGSKLIHHFNTDNSPLFSNSVSGISINSRNGEVFFATEKGLISWMGDATQGESTFQHLYVWPNPVRETWHGDITIDGLAENAEVRIADISGNLVYKTTSNGGRALWDGKNRKGSRVSTGIYLIFCSDPEGNKSKVIKLLFIH